MVLSIKWSWAWADFAEAGTRHEAATEIVRGEQWLGFGPHCHYGEAMRMSQDLARTVCVRGTRTAARFQVSQQGSGVGHCREGEGWGSGLLGCREGI